jgi:hypothetical protein
LCIYFLIFIQCNQAFCKVLDYKHYY